MNAAAGDARNTAAPATSSGRPHRPSGVLATIAPERSASSQSALVSAVVIHPGAIALTRIPLGAQAIASDLVSCAIPPLLALYAGATPLPKKLSIEAMLRMLPR